MSTEQTWVTADGIDCGDVLEVPKYERLAQGLVLCPTVKEAAVTAGWKDCVSLHASIKSIRRNHPEIDLRVKFLLQHRSEVKIFDFDGFCSDEQVIRGIKAIADAVIGTDGKLEPESTAPERNVSLTAWTRLAEMKSLRPGHGDKAKKTQPKEAELSDSDLLGVLAESIEQLPTEDKTALLKKMGVLPNTETQRLDS